SRTTHSRTALSRTAHSNIGGCAWAHDELRGDAGRGLGRTGRLVPAADVVGQSESAGAVDKQTIERVAKAKARGRKPVIAVAVAVSEVVAEQVEIPGKAGFSRCDAKPICARRDGSGVQKAAPKSSGVPTEIRPLNVSLDTDDEARARSELIIITKLNTSLGAKPAISRGRPEGSYSRSNPRDH